MQVQVNNHICTTSSPHTHLHAHTHTHTHSSTECCWIKMFWICFKDGYWCGMSTDSRTTRWQCNTEHTPIVRITLLQHFYASNFLDHWNLSWLIYHDYGLMIIIVSTHSFMFPCNFYRNNFYKHVLTRVQIWINEQYNCFHTWMTQNLTNTSGSISIT